MKACPWIAAMILATVFLASCGGENEDGTSSVTATDAVERSPEPTGDLSRDDETAPKKRSKRPPGPFPLAITLPGRKGPEVAGVLMAEERGYFTRAGLSVSVLTPNTPYSSLGYVVNRTDELGVSHQPQVVKAQAEGAPLIAFGSLVSSPTAAFIWLRDSGIRDIADLKGKTIGFTGLGFQRDLLEYALAQADLTLDDVKVRALEYRVIPSLASGKSDAVFGASANVEGAEFEARGLDPVVTPVSSLGVPSFEEQVWVTRSDFAAENPQVLRRFMSAVERGTAAAIADPEAAARIISDAEETNAELSREGMRAGVEATLPLLSKTGQMNPEKAEELVEWMLDQGWIKREVPVETLLTNRFVR